MRNLLTILFSVISLSCFAQAPTVTVDAKRTITQPLNVATLNGTATGNGGHTIISTTWQVISQPSGANATIRWPNYLISPHFNDNHIYICDLEKVGTYIVQLTALDDASNQTSKNDTIVIAAETFTPCHSTPTSIVLDSSKASSGELWFPLGTAHSVFSSWQPGDTIKIRAKSATSNDAYTLLSIGGLRGNPACPTIIQNVGSNVVTINNVRLGEYISGHQQNTSLSYFRFTGSGVSGIQYGFLLNSPDSGKPCLGGALIHHFEIDHIESTNGAPGMYIKLTPDTNSANRAYVNFPNWVQRSFRIDHNYTHHTKGEGFYIGDYGANGDADHPDASGRWTVPCWADSVEIDHNIFDSTKWTACQYTSGRYGNGIHDNIVTHYGYSNTSSHQAGLALGGNNNGPVYNNIITGGTGNGLQVFGFGRIPIYNNIITLAGYDGTTNGQQSLFGTDSRDSIAVSPHQIDTVYNNLIISPKVGNGVMRFNADNSITDSVIYVNNKFCFVSTPPAGWNTGTSYMMSAATVTVRSGNIEFCFGNNIIIRQRKKLRTTHN